MVRADGCLVLEGLLCSWPGIGCFRHRILASFTFFVVAVGHVRHQHHTSSVIPFCTSAMVMMMLVTKMMTNKIPWSNWGWENSE